MPDDSKLETIPVGSLGIVAHKSCTGLGEKVDHYLVKWRANRDNVHKDNIVFHGYEADTYLNPFVVKISILWLMSETIAVLIQWQASHSVCLRMTIMQI